MNCHRPPFSPDYLLNVSEMNPSTCHWLRNNVSVATLLRFQSRDHLVAEKATHSLQCKPRRFLSSNEDCVLHLLNNARLKSQVSSHLYIKEFYFSSSTIRPFQDFEVLASFMECPICNWYHSDINHSALYIISHPSLFWEQVNMFGIFRALYFAINKLLGGPRFTAGCNFAFFNVLTRILYSYKM